jgi:hypothetical protein
MSGVQTIPLTINRLHRPEIASELKDSAQGESSSMALVSSVLIQKAAPRSKLQAPGSPARCWGKEVPNGIRRVGDSRALRRGLSYLAYQFQSRGEEKHPDFVQYEVEPAFRRYTPLRNSRGPTVGGVAPEDSRQGRREVSRLQVRKKRHETRSRNQTRRGKMQYHRPSPS